MLVIDIFNSRRGVLELGIVNTSQNACCSGSDTCENDVYIYKYGIIVNGKIPNYLGEVIHKQSDCGLKLVESVLSEISTKSLIEFKENIFSRYLINVSINRKKFIEDIIIKKNKSGAFEFGFNTINGSNKIGIKLGNSEFNDKTSFIEFLHSIFHTINHFDGINSILKERVKEREARDFYLFAQAVGF